MATTALETEPILSPTIRSVLGSLRGWILVYVWLEGLAVAATWLGVAFWGTLAIDWFFEPAAWLRGVMLAGVALVLAGVLWRLIVRRTLVRLSNSSMALLLERRFPHLDDSLLTAVELTGRGLGPAECSRHMLARTCREAADRMDRVQLRQVFNPLPLRRAVTASLLLATSVVVFGCVFPDVLGIWAQRMALGDEPWPRRVRLIVEGFEDGVEKVARGGDLEIVAMADTQWEMPERVHVRYRVKGGRWDRKPMKQVGQADPAKEAFQEYSCAFQGILAPVELEVVGEVKMGRDFRVANLRIEVVDSPTLGPMTLHCKFPDYMALQPRSLPVTGPTMPIPRGTQVTVAATANKDLVGVQVECTAGQQPTLRTELAGSALADDGRSFTYTVASLDEDTTLVFTLSDTDGITGREPVRLALTAVADYPPQLTAHLEGIGAAITPQARLPAVGQVTDDYGVGKIWFEYAADEQEPASHPLSAPIGNPTTFPLKDAVLEVRDLKLTAGQKLLVGLKAADLYNLGEGPNVGSSERWLLDLVTPDQLRAMLESRELVLRQRFEAIIQEVTETRDLLLRMDFGTGDADGKTVGQRLDDGSEPGDQPEEISPERLLSRRNLRVQRALTTSTKNAHETDGVADGFDDIRLQLINNRIDTEELIRRLEEGISTPLHRIAQETFPQLETRLQRLQESLDDEKLGPQRRDLAGEKASEILREMHRVLDRMLELEDFNEAVELLRTIIKLQEELKTETEQRHKNKIRELLEGEG